jgi:pimeloyl-ACP methyl ester carboxylesterase
MGTILAGFCGAHHPPDRRGRRPARAPDDPNTNTDIPCGRDPTVDVRCSHYMAERTPGAKYIELPSGDHLPWHADADIVVDEVAEVPRRRPLAWATAAGASIPFME